MKQLTKKIISVAAVSIILSVLVISAFASQAHAAVSWQVTMTAAFSFTGSGGPTTATSTATLGVASDATNGFDTAYDHITPPAPPEGVTSYFYYSGNPSGQKNLDVSIIPSTPSMTWILRVTPIADNDGDMVLSWTAIPAQYDASLKNAAGDTVLADMKAVSQYTYAATASSVQTFTVVLTQSLVVPEYPIGIGIVIAVAACFVGYVSFKKIKVK